jgi:hypothetical protein
MEAHVGDQFIIQSRIAGHPPRTGEIVECMDEGGMTPHYRVRWGDGHESIVYPGGDARVEPVDLGDGMHRRTVSITLQLTADGDHCDVEATMQTSLGRLTATGRARRHPADPERPMVGEELAVARALGSLADQLELAAREGIAVHQSDPAHLVQ